MSSFDPNRALNPAKQTPRDQKVKSERLFVEVESYETPADGFHYAVGTRIDNPEEKVRVRLTTVKERLEDLPKATEAKVKSQYSAGDNVRDSISDKAKKDIKLLSFDDARLIQSENGVKEYRAHWPNTISTDPNAEIVSGMASVRLRKQDADRNITSQAHIELIRSQTLVNKGNIDLALKDALEIKDAKGNPRDPLAIVRASYNGEVIAQPRLYPSVEQKSVFDQTQGESKTVNVNAIAEKTMRELQEGKVAKSDFTIRNHDTIRALIAGVKGEPEPKYNIQNANVKEDIRNLYFGAKEGKIQVEVLAVEQIGFGPDSAKTYLTQKDRAPMNVYNIMSEREYNGEKRQQVSAGYTETVVGIQRHEDGAPYAVYAAPEVMWPKPRPLAELPLATPPKAEITKDFVSDHEDVPDQEFVEELEESYEP